MNVTPTRPKKLPTVVITGATGGLGRILTRNFLLRGHKCILLVRDSQKLDSLIKDNFFGSYLEQITSLECDFASQDWVPQFKSLLNSLDSSPQILINNAGVNTPLGQSWKIPLTDWKLHFEVNFFSPLALTHAFINADQSKVQKWIFNLSGGGATKPMPYFGPYAASKCALVRYTENVALEAKLEGIVLQINAIAPGFLSTDIHLESLKENSPVPEEIRLSIKNQFELGGADPQKTFDLIYRIIDESSIDFSGNLISSIWDNLTEDELHPADFKSELYKLRRIAR